MLSSNFFVCAAGGSVMLCMTAKHSALSSMENNHPHITCCPNGCQSVLFDTNLFVPEGFLRCCPACGQLVSQCNTERYISSNEEWNTSLGTWPSERDLSRLIRRRTRTIRTIMRMLSRNCSDIHLLDVGCSSGAFIWIARDMGIDAEGVEPAGDAVRTATDRGLKVHQGLLAQIHFPENSFHAITLFEVIEHVDNPQGLLRECHRILCPGGVLVIGTGNTDSWTRQILGARWDLFDIRQHGGHISFFSTRSMRTLASRTGFDVSKLRTASVKFGEKTEMPRLLYRLAKIASELLNGPARLVNKGHQMEAFLISTKNA